MNGTMTRKGRTPRQGRKHVPQRQCALTKAVLPVDQLVRFVLSPEQMVTPDLHHRLPGRGLWLRAERRYVEQATKKDCFARGFRKKVVASANLADTIYELSKNDAMQRLSLANKAGLVITGYEKLRDALARGRISWLLHAREAAAGGTRKLDAFFSMKQGDPQGQGAVPLSGGVLPALFTGAQLSLALGRENVIHVGLKAGGAVDRFVAALQRAVAFEPQKEDRPSPE